MIRGLSQLFAQRNWGRSELATLLGDEAKVRQPCQRWPGGSAGYNTGAVTEWICVIAGKTALRFWVQNARNTAFRPPAVGRGLATFCPTFFCHPIQVQN